ncbi:Peroxynitrite isomerase THAP4, partial [Frankliniella fusca]
GMLKIWESKISRQNWKMKETDRLCELHFSKDDIIDYFEVEVNGKTIREPLTHKTLKPTAVPVFFPHKEPPKPPRKLPAKRETKTPPVMLKSLNVTKYINLHGNEDDHTFENEDNEPSPGAPFPQTFGESLFCDSSVLSLPDDWYVRRKESIVCLHINNNIEVDRYVVFDKNPDVVIDARVFLDKKEIPSLRTAYDFLKKVNSLVLCPGTGIKNVRSDGCYLYVGGKPGQSAAPRCHSCFPRRKALQKQNLRNIVAVANRKKKHREIKRTIKNQKSRISTLQDKLGSLMKKIEETKQDNVDKLLASLPTVQGMAVKACINAARAKSPKGRRYTKEWMYGCILMRMKGPALYRKMQQQNILALPSPRTIQRYLKKMKPAYGFQRTTFDLLGQKSAEMSEAQRHGALLFDEMKLTEGLSFDKKFSEGSWSH